MPSPWPTAQLGTVTVNHDSRRSPVREIDRKAGPYPYYGASGVVDHVDEYIFEGLHLLIAEDGENLRSRQTPVAFLADGKFWVNNHAHIVTGNERADTRYLCYALISSDISGYLTGSAMPKLTQKAMNAIEIPLPPIGIQRGIAGVLGTLDDKIEHNRRTSRALESLARAIFKAWFVDFEPVKAKAAGAKSFPSMPQPAFDALPNRFTDSELGPIPAGWKAGQMGDVGVTKRDQVAPEDINEETPYFGLEHMPRHSIALSEWGNVGSVVSGKFRFASGDILFGKLRPYFHKVGIAPIEGVCSTDIVVLAPKTKEWRSWLLMLVSSDEFVSHADQTSAGTKMPRTNWSDMADFATAVPPEPLSRVFEAITRPMIDLTLASIHESRKLAELRDLLLPKLMSGEVRVRDAQRALTNGKA